MDYQNLQSKTIFNFCKDENLRKEIIGGDYSESYYKEFPKPIIAGHIMEFAFRTKNKPLFDAAQAFQEKAQFNNDSENDEAQKNGSIID